VLGLSLGLDLVFKQCSLCRERHWCYAHGWPGRQFIIINKSPSIAGENEWISWQTAFTLTRLGLLETLVLQTLKVCRRMNRYSVFQATRAA